MTHKVVRVKFCPHRSDTSTKDRLLTGLTDTPARLVIVGFTKRFSVVFEKAPIDKGAVALLEKCIKKHSEAEL